MSAARVVLLTLVAGLFFGGCGRWMDYAPVRLKGQVNNSGAVYAKAIRRATTMGYYVQADPAHRSFRVLARLDQHKRRAHLRASYFHVTVQRDGSVDVMAYGRHFRRGGTLIHRKLCNELTYFLNGLAAELGPSHGPVLVGMR
jgi:hypothetical protein